MCQWVRWAAGVVVQPVIFLFYLPMLLTFVGFCPNSRSVMDIMDLELGQNSTI